MKNHKVNIIVLCLLFLLVTSALAAGGGGRIKLGYTVLDEEGNRAVNQSTFNQYEGLGLSLENFKYGFRNGMRLSANLEKITLNNRNLNFGFDKPGLFGVRLYNNQYRRAYDFDGNAFTRRHQTGGSVWLIPHRYIRIYGGGFNIGKKGKMADLFDAVSPALPVDIDYKQMCYNAGININYRGRMLQADYRSAKFTNNLNTDRDQSRYKMSLLGIFPVPRYEWIVLSGGFHHFETKHHVNDFKISSNRVWGGGKVKLPQNFSFNYNFVFDRASSDSDIIATDNLSHAFYLSHLWPGLAELTAGYQNDINDDFEDAVKANSAYFYGWLKPHKDFEFRGECGFRSETVDDGARLVGDEDRNRFKLSGKYTHADYGSIALKFEGKNRQNDQIGSEADFNRFSSDAVIKLCKCGELSGGYSFSKGEYSNREQEFTFEDHQLYGDITSKEYYGITAGFGALYYRSKRDLDVESFTLRFNAAYRFMKDYSLDVTYNVHNFDDFLVTDQYYTANIVEINLIKAISF